MILDDLTAADRYASIHPDFRRAFEYLRTQPLEKLSPGIHEIDGKRLYVNIVATTCKGQGGKLEAHRQYIDIQYTVRGDERIGWRGLARCHKSEAPFDDTRDVEFFLDAPEAIVPVGPGSFAIFFPEDPHMPAAGSGEILKAVVKVRI